MTGRVVVSLPSPALVEVHREQQRAMHRRTLAYFLEAESFLQSHGAKSWNETHSEEPSTALRGDEPSALIPLPLRVSQPPPKLFSYRQYAKYSWQNGPEVGQHTLHFYDHLFEACWRGDNKSIEELCLPKHQGKHGSVEPIQITVVAKPNNLRGWFVTTSGIAILTLSPRCLRSFLYCGSS